MKTGSRIVIVALGLCVAVLLVIVVIQQRAYGSIVRNDNNGNVTIQETKSINAVQEYDAQFFRYSYDIAKEKRRKDSLYNRLTYIVNSAEDAVKISDIALKNTYTGGLDFKKTRAVEYDEENRLWVVKYNTNSWPSGIAIIIIDQYDGAVLFCEMPHG